MITADRTHTSTATPTLRREGITWRNQGEMVEISIEVYNDHFETTEPQTLVIEAASFGAFIPHVPVARVAVGSLDPGERRTLTASVGREQLEALSSPVTAMMALIDRVRGIMVDPGTARHWIGNFNVYFDRRPDLSVERHGAWGLRVPASAEILGLFIVFEGLNFEVVAECDNPDWSAAVETRSLVAVLTVNSPEKVGDHCHVSVQVTRITDGACVPVEFDFETVQGWGDTAGCVKV